MNKGSGFVLFLAGFIVGFLCFGFLFGALFTTRVESVEYLEQPDQMFKVIIDDVVFTCSSEPEVDFNKVSLWGCEETRGRKLVIKNFDSYSVELIE